MSDDILHSQLLDIIRNKEMSNDMKLAKIDMLIRLGVDVNAIMRFMEVEDDCYRYASVPLPLERIE